MCILFLIKGRHIKIQKMDYKPYTFELVSKADGAIREWWFVPPHQSQLLLDFYEDATLLEGIAKESCHHQNDIKFLLVFLNQEFSWLQSLDKKTQFYANEVRFILKRSAYVLRKKKQSINTIST